MNPIDIAIKLRKEGDGATQATKDINQATAAAEALNKSGAKGAEVAKDQAKNFNDLGETMDKGAGAGRVLAEVMRGNVMAIGQLGPVLKAVGQAFKANPLFLIGSIAATLILPAFKAISDGWKKQAEEAKKAGDAAEESMQRARTAIAAKADNALAQTYKDIATAAQIAEQRITAVTTAQVAQTDAREAVDLAAIDADPSMSNKEKLLAKLEVQEDARRERAAAQVKALNEQDAIAAAAAEREAGAVAGPQRQEEIARARVVQVAARSPAAIKRELDANKLAEHMEARNGTLRGDRAEELMQRRADLQAELAAAEEKFAGEMRTAEEALVAAIKKREEAETKAAEAAAAAVATKEINDIKRGTLNLQTETASTVAEIQTGAALPKAEAADTAAQAEADDAAVRDGLLNNVTTGAQRYGGKEAVKAGRAARAAGNTEIEAAAKRALDAANATRDGTTEDEAKEILAAFAALEAALTAKNQESVGLKALVKGLAAQVDALARTQSANRTLD